MAHSAQDIKIAEKVGKSPATIERHRRLGMWPADAFADLARHYEVMDACGVGVGQSRERDWAVALDAAEQFDWPIVLLRKVLLDPPMDLVTPALHTRIRALFVGMAQHIEDLVPYEDPATALTADPAEAVVDDAYRTVRKMVISAPTETEDFTDLGELVATVVDQAVFDGVPDDDSSATDRPFAVETRELLSKHVGRFTSTKPWAIDATPVTLVAAVKMSAHLVDTTNTLAPTLASTGDQRRAEIAALAGRLGVILDLASEVTDGNFAGPEFLPVLDTLVLTPQTGKPEAPDPPEGGNPAA